MHKCRLLWGSLSYTLIIFLPSGRESFRIVATEMVTERLVRMDKIRHITMTILTNGELALSMHQFRDILAPFLQWSLIFGDNPDSEFI